MTHKALVLSGGNGSRLRPFSHSSPKQLVPVANKPVLFHALEDLRSAGITDVGLVVSTPGAAIRDAVGDGSRFDLAITYIDQDEPLGLAHAVRISQDYLGDDDFVMYLGDNVFAGGIAEHLADFRTDGPAAQLLLAKVSDPCQYGIAELDEAGRVVALQEKPVRPRSDLAVTGAYFFSSKIHEAVRSIRPSWRNEWEITDALQWLVTDGQRVTAQVFSGYWKDTGTLGDLLDCNKVMTEGISTDIRGSVDQVTHISGPVIVEAGTRIERCVIVGPVIIGAGSTVLDSYIGPYTSLGNGCQLRNAGVEFSILLDRASVQDVRSIHSSIIGRAGEVSRSEGGASTHRLVIGDDSRIEVPA
jgi:glucose-1-phosphate thymidylyltransferase